MDEEEFAKLVAQAAGMQPDEATKFLTEQGLSADDVTDALDVLNQLNDNDITAKGVIAEKEPADAAERIASDEINEIEEQAQKMADEDDTPVKVTEEDSDSDGDTDKVTAEKKETDDDEVKNPSEEHSEAADEPNDSDELSEDEKATVNKILNGDTDTDVSGIAKTSGGSSVWKPL